MTWDPQKGMTYGGQHGVLNSWPSVVIPDYEEQVRNSAWLAAYAKLNAGMYDFGATLGELRETARTLASIVNRLPDPTKLWTTIRMATNAHALRKRRESLPKKLAGAWLEWRYGIRPLMWEAIQILEALTEKLEADNRLGFKAVRAHASRTWSTVTTQNCGGYHGLRYYADIHVKNEVKAYATVYYSVDQSSLASALMYLRKYGLSPEQGLPLVWELTPLSFVVDWFVDIKSWLQALCRPIGIKVLGDSVSVKTSRTFVRKPLQWDCATYREQYYPRAQFRGMPGQDVYSLQKLTRRVNNGQPGLSQVLTLNPKSLTSGKWIDILAIAISRFFRR
jgi:hypothetical protein